MSRVAVRRRRLRSARPETLSPILPPREPPHPDLYYTEMETAAYLRLRSAKTLTIWRCRGEHPELKFEKPYGRILYRGSAILDFLSGAAKPRKSAK